MPKTTQITALLDTAVLIALGDNNLLLCYKMWVCFCHLLLKGHMPIRSPREGTSTLVYKKPYAPGLK